jgi:hypothetical protein
VDRDRHAQELEDAYLVTRAKRRTLAMERQEPLILEGIPVHPPERRTNIVTPPAPPPSEISEVEPLLPPTQPSPREDADPQPNAAEVPPEPRNEAVRSDEVD